MKTRGDSMKRIVSIFTAVFLCALTFVSSGAIPKSWEPAKAAKTAKYTLEDIKNLQDFLLCKELRI